MEKKVILVADDEPMCREIIRKNFNHLYKIVEAKDGQEALDILHDESIDLAILDIVMPKVTGFDILQRVKCDEKYSDLKIIVATSLNEKTERQALDLGADDIIFKPYDPVVVKKRLSNLSTMQDQKRELEKALKTAEQALEKAEQANKAKTDFLSRISHDMRTPLNGILGITTLLKDVIVDDKIYQDIIQLEMSGKYLLDLVNDTLDVNKIEIGKLELHPGVFDGRTCLNNLIELARPNIDSKRIEFKVQADHLTNELIYIDMGRLQQLIMNIIGNAVKFTPEEGEIDVHISNISHDDKIVREKIVISDNGIGMSKEFLPHLFEPFSQENPGSTGNINGTGLGMAITKKVVELMGGTIQVESELRKGTTCILEIPIPIATKEQIVKWKLESNLDYTKYKFEGIRVLLCEDHPLNAQIAARLLEKQGIEVKIAKDGKEGVELFQASDDGYFNLILMDIRMPIMDGLQATRAIRRLVRKDAYKIPIIAMTANAFDEDIRQTRAAGMNAHLGKPIEVDKLYHCIADLLFLKKQEFKKKILIVDDLEMNRLVVSTALEDEFIVLEAENGLQALDILEKTSGIELVITDIQMPEMNGLDLIRKIRANKKYDKVKIIANTQFGDPEQEEEIIDLGADDFVYKPTTPKIIELRVRNTMNRL